jgi:hypothetical protein
MELPADRFFNLVYYFATEDAEEAAKNRFDVRLHMPDARARRRAAERGAPDASSPWSKENEEAALGGLVAALRGD